MILAIIYFLVFYFLASKLSFFKDIHLSFKVMAAILIVKCVGCLAYYWVYFCYYPQGFNGDSVTTLHDAKVMYSALPNNKLDFLKMIFGWHSESHSDPLYDPYFYNIQKWGRADITSDFFLNDNRTPTRFNAVIMLFSFGQYAVHALVMLIMSFIGQLAFYKTLKVYFPKKELLLATIIFLTPSILFWTSGILKEPISICFLGVFIYSYFKLFVNYQFKFKYILLLIICSFFLLIVKPYIITLLLVPLVLFSCVNYFKICKVGLFYFSSIIILYSLGILALKFGFNKDVINTVVIRQNDFVSLSLGGRFFLNNDKYVALDYSDTTSYKLVDAKKQLYQLKPHSNFLYWDINYMKDTIFETNNLDTSYFALISVCPPAGSAIKIDRLKYTFSSFAKIIPQSFFNVLFKPFFYDSKSILELISSIENLLFVLIFGFCFSFKNKIKLNNNLLLLCITVVITSFILIGITTTVTGAIVRYKVPFIPFLLMIPLLYLDVEILKKIPLIKYIYHSKS